MTASSVWRVWADLETPKLPCRSPCPRMAGPPRAVLLCQLHHALLWPAVESGHRRGGCPHHGFSCHSAASEETAGVPPRRLLLTAAVCLVQGELRCFCSRACLSPVRLQHKQNGDCGGYRVVQDGALLLCLLFKGNPCGFEGIQPIQQGLVIRPGRHGAGMKQCTCVCLAAEKRKRQTSDEVPKKRSDGGVGRREGFNAGTEEVCRSQTGIGWYVVLLLCDVVAGPSSYEVRLAPIS